MSFDPERTGNAIGKLVKGGQPSRLTIGTATHVNDDGSLQVLDGNESARAARLCNASEGDRVGVLQCSGIRAAIGRVGGDADCIVERGTDGIWTYRRWSSGDAECWGIHRFTKTLGVRGNVRVPFPDGLFASGSDPVVSASLLVSGMNDVAVNYVGADAAVADIWVVAPSGSGDADAALYLQVRGMWE